MAKIILKTSFSLLHNAFREQLVFASCARTYRTLQCSFLNHDFSPCITQQRHRTTQKIHKARKKGRLHLRDQKRLAEKEKFQDPAEFFFGMLKKSGMRPGRPANKRPLTVTCTSGIFEAYVPPEGDGRSSSLSPEGAKQRVERVKNVGVARMALRKIRKFEPEFTTSEFAWKGQEIYNDVHKHLVDFDEDKLHMLVTEKLYPELTETLKLKTLQWKFLESLEKPRVVHMRCTEVMSKNNTFAQVTVRMLTRQTIALYDRFGRLMLGSEEVPKDVLEYVVFEKHLTHLYGTWRLHSKIIPEWSSHLEPVIATRILPEEKAEVKEMTETAV